MSHVSPSRRPLTLAPNTAKAVVEGGGGVEGRSLDRRVRKCLVSADACQLHRATSCCRCCCCKDGRCMLQLLLSCSSQGCTPSPSSAADRGTIERTTVRMLSSACASNMGRANTSANCRSASVLWGDSTMEEAAERGARRKRKDKATAAGVTMSDDDPGQMRRRRLRLCTCSPPQKPVPSRLLITSPPPLAPRNKRRHNKSLFQQIS